MPQPVPRAVLKLSQRERGELQRQAECSRDQPNSARHARLILLLADGSTWAEIRNELHCSDSYIARWSNRFKAERLAGLYSRHAGRERYKVTDSLEARVLKLTRQRRPADGNRHWSTRRLASELGGAISHATVARIWSRHGITGQRVDDNQTTEAAFARSRVLDIVGLYLTPHLHAAAFRLAKVDTANGLHEQEPPSGKTPRRPARPIRQQPREGVRALYSALTSSTEAPDEAANSRQTSAEFAAFLAAVAAEQPDASVRVIVDNPVASKAPALSTFVVEHPQVTLQMTADYVSWLSQVEQCLLADDDAPPRHELKLMRHLRRASQRSRSMKWKRQSTPRESDTEPPPR